MNDFELLIQNVNRIVSSLELTEDIQRRIIISLVRSASFSKSKNLLLKELYSYDCDADSIEPEINQMLAFGLLKEGALNRKVRLTLVRDLWKLKADNVEATVKAVKSIVNKNYEYDFIKIVKEVKKNLIRYKLIDQVIGNKALKIITTCSLVRSADWGFVDNVVVRVEKSLGVIVQDKLFSDLSFKDVSQSDVEANNDFRKRKIVKKPINKTSKRSMPMLTDPSRILSVAQEILYHNKSGMHVDAIAAEAVNKNKNMGMTGDEMSKKLSQALSQNVKAKVPVFVRVLNKNGSYKRGVYKLKQVRNAPLHAQIEPPQVDTGYFGKAGEYAVSSELLFWGYNVSLMAVDQGVDLVASKEGHYYHLQVKTATPQSQSDGSTKYQFTILEKTFTANHNSTMWYVFVLRKKASNDYVIMASSELLRQRTSGLINGKDFSVKITSADKGKRYLMSGKVDINSNINNFALIV